MNPEIIQKRIEICQDVINQIRENNLHVKSSSYYISGLKPSYDQEMATPQDVAEVRENCTVCAKGALLLSRIDKFNSIRRCNIWGTNSSCMAGLTDIFDARQLDLIEICFEGWNDDPNSTRSLNPRYPQWLGFQPPQRLIAICENIIRNKGEFDPVNF